MTLIFGIHYFLWYGALTSIFGYESVYARHYTNATPMQYGYLNMVLPFMTVLVTPLICSLADRQRSHRSYFTLSLVLTTISICFYALMPLLVGKTRHSNHLHSKTDDQALLVGPWIYYCFVSLVCDLSMGINTCLSDSFAVLQAEEQGSNFGRIIVWGTFGWASSAMILSLINQWSGLPRLVPGLVFGATLMTIDVIVVSFWPDPTSFKLDFIPRNAAQTVTGSASSAHKDPSDYLPLNESARINLGSSIKSEDGAYKRRMKTRSPVEIVVSNRANKNQMIKRIEQIKRAEVEEETDGSSAVSELNSGLKTINSNNIGMNESKLSHVVGTNRNSQVVSPYNKSPTSIKVILEEVQVVGSINQQAPSTTGERISQRTENRKKGENGQREDSQPSATSFKMQLTLLGLILMRRKSLIRYLILFVLSGFFMSMHWNYFFLYLERIYHDKFELISALSMVGQSVLGELPFFILSRKVIEFCGRSHTLSISVISIGIRFLLYGYFLPNVDMYFITLADCFQGPNYGLFYVVMTEVGLEFSYCDTETIEHLAARGHLDPNNRSQVDSVRLSLRSTVQSVAFACYEGIGVGLGSLAGGWIVGSFGFKILWLSMAVCSISVGLINLAIEFTCPEHNSEAHSEQREFMHASRMGILKKLASPTVLPGQVRADPIAQSPQWPAQTTAKIAVMTRKSAGSRVAP